MWTVEQDTKGNSQKFMNDKFEVVNAPIIINDRYEVKSIFSLTNGNGVIYHGIDTKLNDRKVLIKSRRYENEHGLFSYKNDLTRKNKINKIREQMEFECDCLVTFKKQGETRMPNINDVVNGFSPSLYGPHVTIDGETYYNDDFEVYNNEPYIIMQMMSGINLGEYVDQGIDFVLKDRLYTKHSMWEWDVMQYAIELCEILAGFHKDNVERIQSNSEVKCYYYIYQDLKPENIIVTDDLFVSLLNFDGMTMIVKYKDGREVSNIQGFGYPGFGTPGYQSPESRNQAMLGNLDRRVDIYAFGATLFHLLTGKNLNKSLNVDDVIPVEEIEEHYTRETYELIKRCVEQDREKRFRTFEDIKDYIMDDIIPVINREK